MLAMLRRVLAVIGMTIGLLGGVAWGQESVPPTDVEVQTALQDFYAAPKQGLDGSTYDEVTIDWTKMKRGKPHEGDFFADGTPANAVTIVFPILAEYVVHRTVISDRSESSHAYRGQYGFFQNEFQEWQFSAYSHEQVN